MAGVATEKPGSHLCHWWSVFFATQSYWLGNEMKQTSRFIYLFSETRRGYREVELSDGSFTTCGYYETPNELDPFSLFCLRLRSVVQKSSGRPRQQPFIATCQA